MKFSKLKTFQIDPVGSVAYTIDELFLIFSCVVSTIYCNLNAYFWNIKLGSKCQFFGATHFKRYPCSKIIIGKYCKFRSSFRSNFVGLNRACGFSTHSKTAVIRVGVNCGFSGTSIAAFNSIVIGNEVIIGANTIITDFDWHFVRATGKMASAPVIIEDNVWLGANCIVLKGVNIGKNTIVGANSVVTRSLPENVLAGGNPACVIRSLM
jgi:acetyltransferase-like isoleucine patch superfamily enzyme